MHTPRSFSYLALSDARYGEFGKAPSTLSDPVGVLYIINFLKRLTCYQDLNNS